MEGEVGRAWWVGEKVARGSGAGLPPCVEEDPRAAPGLTRRETEARLWSEMT